MSMMKEAVLCRSHDFLENDAGEMMLVIEAREGAPDDAVLMLAEGGEAILQRRSGDMIRLDAVHPDAMTRLRQRAEIFVTEIDDEDILYHYRALTSDVGTAA